MDPFESDPLTLSNSVLPMKQSGNPEVVLVRPGYIVILLSFSRILLVRVYSNRIRINIVWQCPAVAVPVASGSKRMV